MRLDCGFTDSATCISNGCCWHSALSMGMVGPVCYRADLFIQNSMKNFALAISNYIPAADRLSTTDNFLAQCGYASSSVNYFYLPLPGQSGPGFAMAGGSACFMTGYAGWNTINSSAAAGYTYRNSTTGNYIVCDAKVGSRLAIGGILSSSSLSASECLQTNGCWWSGYGCSQPSGIQSNFTPPFTPSTSANTAISNLGTFIVKNQQTGDFMVGSNAGVVGTSKTATPLLFQVDPTVKTQKFNSTRIKVMGNFYNGKSLLANWTPTRFVAGTSMAIAGANSLLVDFYTSLYTSKYSYGFADSMCFVFFSPPQTPTGSYIIYSCNSLGVYYSQYGVGAGFLSGTTIGNTVSATQFNIQSISSIQSKLNPVFCLTQYNGTALPGFLLSISPCTGAMNQWFTYNSVNQTLTTFNGGYCLDFFSGGNAVAGTLIVQAVCSGVLSQSWVYNPTDSTLRPSTNTNLCLDITGSSVSINTGLQVQSCGSSISLSQSWSFVVPSFASSLITNNGTIQYQNGTCLTQANGDSSPGNQLITANCSFGNVAQTMVLNADGRILIGNGGLCMSAIVSQSGSPVSQLFCNGGPGQRWVYNSSALTISLSSNTSICLDTTNNGSTKGGGVWIGACNGGSSQMWIFNSGSPQLLQSSSSSPLAIQSKFNPASCITQYNGTLTPGS